MSEQLQTLQPRYLASFFGCIKASQVDVLPVVHDTSSPPSIRVSSDTSDTTTPVRTLPVLLVLLAGNHSEMPGVGAESAKASVVDLPAQRNLTIGELECQPMRQLVVKPAVKVVAAEAAAPLP